MNRRLRCVFSKGFQHLFKSKLYEIEFNTYTSLSRKLQLHCLLLSFLVFGIGNANELKDSTKGKDLEEAFVSYVVMNTSDSGAGSLRQAMLDAVAAGAGPHSITFDPSLSGQTIDILSSLPTISVDGISITGDIDADGTPDITVNAGGGDINRAIFLIDAGGTNVSIKGFNLIDTGTLPFYFTSTSNGVTIEDITLSNSSGDFIDHFAYFTGAASNVTIQDATVTDIQNINHGTVHFQSTATTVNIDNFNLSDSGGGVMHAIRFVGVATGITIQNCDLDLDLTGNADDGNYGILFSSNGADDVTIDNCTMSNIDNDPIQFSGTSNNVDITNFTYTNGEGGTGNYGIRFVGNASDITLTTVSLDMDHTATTDDGDYGVSFDGTATTINIDGLTIHDGEIYGLNFTGVATDVSIINSIIDNFDGYINNVGIRFGSTLNGLVMTDVSVDADITGSTDDGNYGIDFLGDINQDNLKTAILTRVTVKNADEDNIRVWTTTDNLTLEDCTITRTNDGVSNEDGIEFYQNVERTNVVINNSTFTNNGRAAILVSLANGTISDITISNNTITNTSHATNGYGLWLYAGDGNRDVTISGNTIANNSNYGIYTESADGINITQNNMYANGTKGIGNFTNANNDLQFDDEDYVFISNSVDAGGGNYDITITLPSFCADCDVEFFTNNAGDSNEQGRVYAGVATNLAAGTHTISGISSGGNTTGFWTATLKDNNQNGSVSEFGTSFAIAGSGPGNVVAGNTLWLKADVGVTDADTSVSSWIDQSARGFGEIAKTIFSNPDLQDNVFGFNPAVNFDGDDYFTLGDQGILQPLASAGEVFLVLKNNGAHTTNDGYPIQFGGSNTLTEEYDFSDGNIYAGFGALDRKNWDPRSQVGKTPVDVLNPNIFNMVSTASDWTANFNGATNYTVAGNTIKFSTSSSNHTHVGASNSSVFNGDIAEIVLFDRELTSTERSKVDSYLAFKYGITLDQLSATAYIASDGTTKIWDETTNATYNKDIFGIGRDDNGGLNQKVGTSLNSGAILSVALDNDFTNPNNSVSRTSTFANDLQFLAIANDGGATTTQASELDLTNYDIRTVREWQVQNTGAVGAVNLKFEGFANYDVLADTDGDFSTTGDQTVLATLNANSIAENITLTDGVYLTLAKAQNAPGGISTNLAVWLKAENGGKDWIDQSPNPITVTNTGTLTEIEGGLNFNKTIEFTDATARYDYGYDFNRTVEDELTIIGIFNPTATSQNVFNSSASSNHRYIYSNVFGHGAQAFLTARTNEFNIYNGQWDNDGVSGDTYFRMSGEEVFSVDEVGGNYNSLPRTGPSNTGAQIAEFIVFNERLADIDASALAKVESYLAIKYGITLDQTTATPYLNANGDKVWDETVDGAYKYDIFGIARDNDSELNQQISKSINSRTILTVSTDSDFTSSNGSHASLTSGQFLLFANNGALTNTKADELDAANYNNRIAREWLVQNTGSVGAVNVKFEGFGGYDVLSDTDGDFSTTGDQTLLATLDGNGEATNITFTDDAYITLANNVVAPGGVLAATGTTNGIAYELYSDYDATPENGITGTLKQTGYVATLTHPDDFFLNEISDSFSMVLHTSLQITTGGDYQFRFFALDDDAALFVDGVLQLQGDGGTPVSGNVNLTAGLHTLEIRFSENGGGETLHLQYSGPDNSNSFGDIPENVLFITAPILSAWYKADGTLANTGHGTNVTSWEDASQNGNDMTLAVGNPTYNTTSDLVNFNQSVTLTDDQLESADDVNGLAFGNSAKTIFTVFTKTTFNGGAGWISSLGRDGVTSATFGAYTYADDLTFAAWANDIVVADYITQNDFPHIATGTYQNSNILGANNAFWYADGQQIGNETKVWTTQANDGEDLSIGAAVDNQGDGHDGKVMEVIYYPWALNAIERQKVESYLAIKYGTTLDQSTVASDDGIGDYTLSNGTVIFDAHDGTSVNAYNHDIFGIARDDNGDLNQKVSTSANMDDIVTIALDNNFTVANNDATRTTTHANNLQALVIANNDGAIATQLTELDVATGFNNRLTREWQVKATNFSQTINLKFAGYDDSWSLITTTDGDFSGSVTTVGTLNADGEITGVSLADGVTFTLAKVQEAPGGVVSDIALWFKANDNGGVTTDGTTISTLTNHGSAADAIATGDPSYESDASSLVNFNHAMNFNPGIDFELDESDNMVTSLIPATGANARTLIAVFKNETIGTANYSHVLHYGSEGSEQTYGLTPRTSSVNEFGNHYWIGSHTSGFAMSDGQSAIGITSYDGTTDNLFLNGALGTTPLRTLSTGSNDGLKIGARRDGTLEFFDGQIMEVISYAKSISTSERQQIESYLALKYGVTLNSGATDYLSSDGTTTKMWTAADNTGYISDIFGIGRDDNQELDQRVSKSVNAGTIVTLALDADFTVANNDAARTTAHANDKQFLTIANNAGAVANQLTELDALTGFNTRLTREWKVDATNFSQDVNMKFTGYNADWSLITTTDGDFSDSVITVGALNSDGEITGVTLTDGITFTLAKLQEAPGGIATGVTAWFKADASVYSDGGTTLATAGTNNIQEWHDQSSNVAFVGNQPTQTSASLKPSFVASADNFNPTVRYEAVDNVLTTPSSFDSSNLRGTTANTATIYAVVNRAGSGTGKRIFDHGNGNSRSVLFDNQSAIGQSGSSNYTVDVGTSTVILSTTRNGSSGTTAFNYLNGVANGSGSASDNVHGSTTLHLGRGGSGGDDWEGDISEVIFYSEAHDTGTTRQQIESYLALKYGITLNSGATDYLSSEGVTTKMWAVADNAGYISDIFGIGRDDIQALDQRIAKSVNTGTIVTLALDADFTVANNDVARTTVHTNDKQFLTIANNAGAVANQVGELQGDLAFTDRLIREWKVDATNFSQNVNLKFTGYDSDWALITSTDGDFSSDVTVVGDLNADGEISGVSLADGVYFTIAYADRTASNAALAEILEDSASPGGANNANTTAVSLAELNAIVGVSGITSDNLAAYQTAIAAKTDFSSPPTAAEVQAIVDTVNATASASAAALAEILEDSASTGGANNTNGTPVSLTELQAITGLTGVTAGNLAGYQESIAAATNLSNPPTVAEVQALVDATNSTAVIVGNSNDPADGDPSVTDLTNAGVTGTVAGNEAAYEVAISNASPAPNTLAELQAIIDQVNSDTALAEILEDSASTGGANNTNGTPVSLAELEDVIGLTGVTSDNLAAYQAAIASEAGFSNPPTAVEVQSIVDTVNTAATASADALAEILEDSASTGGANNANSTPVSLAELQAITGLTGITEANLASYQAAIASEAGFSNPPLVSEVQAIVNTVNTAQDAIALNEVLEDSNSAGGADNANATPVTADQLNAIVGISGVNAGNLAGYQEAINAETGFSNPPTAAEVQAIVDATNSTAVIVGNSSDPADGDPSATDLTNAGITGVVAGNITAYEEVIANASPAPNTLTELQAIVDEVNNVAIVVVSSGSGILTQAELTNAGVTETGLTPMEIDAVEAAVVSASPAPQTTAELQAIATSAITTLNVESNDDDEFNIHPNPTSGKVYLSEVAAKVIVYDAIGQKVATFNNTASIDITDLNEGMYLISIETEKGTIVKRLVKK